MADKKADAPKNKAIRDSEGLPVVSTHKDEAEPDNSANEAAKAAYEEEVAKDVDEAAQRKALEDYDAYIGSAEKFTMTLEEFTKARDKAKK